MYVSTGAAKVDRADACAASPVGKAQSDAQRQANLQSSVVFEPTTSKGNDGKVVSQNPTGGAQATPQSTVVLTVGEYTAPPTTTPTTARRRPPPRPGRDRAPTGRALARWYEANGRHDLPWRATRDRWLVLVSEVMLHQTQAPRVAQVYDAFVAQFPTPAATGGRGPGRGDRGVGPARLPAPRPLAVGSGRAHRRPTVGPTTCASSPASAATPRPRSRRRSTTPTRSASR